eukprot:gene11714-11859_t
MVAGNVTYVKGLAIEPWGQIPYLWATFFAFGNLFALFWLSRAFLNAHPEISYKVSQVLARLGLARGKRRKMSAQHSSSVNGDGLGITEAAAEHGGDAGRAVLPAVVPASHHHHHITQPQDLCTEQNAAGAANGHAEVFGAATDTSSSVSSDDASDVQLRTVQLDWRNMSYGVKTSRGKKMILQGIYGSAKPFQLQGLMGPSGAGKSTLMDLLTMRTTSSSKEAKAALARAAAAASMSNAAASAVSLPVIEAAHREGVSGQLLVNGQEVSRRDFMSISAYVPQHDNLVPTMTAYEAVTFYARIILPSNTPRAVRKGKISRVLQMMGLTQQQHTLVGGTLPGGILLRGMSGGERKRLAIACGVVAGPSLVFLDEPTSGLDSFAALNVVLFLKSMASQRGATLLASLHQPRSAIWNQMDQVTLLSSGRLMYTGPTDDLVTWFSSLGYYYDAETHGMALDSYTSPDGASGLATQSHASSSSSPYNASAVVVGCVPALCTGDKVIEKGDVVQQELLVPKVLAVDGQRVAAGPRLSWSDRFTAGWCKYKALLGRELLITTRNPADVGGRLMTFTYVAFLSGLVTWNTSGLAEGMFDRLGVAYAVLSFYLLMPFVFMSIFTSDKRFFAADTAARLYHPLQYFLAKISIAMPFNIIVAVVFHFVYYGMVGMRHGWVPMLESCGVSVLTGLIAMQAIYCCAIMASSQDLSFVYAIAWTALNLLVNPYMALFQGYSLGWGFSWLRFTSPFNFAWQALVKIEFSGRGFDCNGGSGLRAINVFPELLPTTGNFKVIKSSLNNLGPRSTNGQCVASGDAIVAMYTSDLTIGEIVAILGGYFLLLMTLTYFVVWRSSKTKLKA